MSVDDEILMAFADGELSEARMADVAEAVAADPALQARLERFQEVRARVAALADAAPVPPQGLMDAARRKVAAEAVHRRRNWTPALAAAVGGLAVGLGVLVADRQDQVLDFQDGMAAQGVLQAALDGTASGQATRRGDVAVTPLYTVVAADGRACRVFRTVEGQRAYEGAACREGGAWRLLAIAAVPPPPGGYAQASGEEPPAVAAAVDELSPGDPLPPAEEAGLIRRRWSPARE